MVYKQPRFELTPPPTPELNHEHSVVIVGAGLVGLTLALDLGLRGINVIVLDEDDTVSDGSRAIVFARRSLEILNRLGLGKRLLDKGVAWKKGTVYHKDTPLFQNIIEGDSNQEHPLFLNLQQYYLEEWLVEACIATQNVELRWRHKVISVQPLADGAALLVETPIENYKIECKWLLACDGAKSFIRRSLNLPFLGKVFQDRFLIVDIKMQSPLPAERRFWFSPSFHPGQSVLIHKQPDDIWRVDFQLGWNADPEIELQSEQIQNRLRKMFGELVAFDIVWASIYTFQCRRLERFRHNHIIFVGDSAHQVSPFGGRGGNGGIQDADNLAWKIAAILSDKADERLLDTYDSERCLAADENILHSTRSAEFITPKSQSSSVYRDAVLALARNYEFARKMVNSGRLSTPATLASSPLNYISQSIKNNILPLGSPAPDIPVLWNEEPDWVLHHIGGQGFTLMIRAHDRDIEGRIIITLTPYPSKKTQTIKLIDKDNLIDHKYGIIQNGAMLFRPDQHLCAHFEKAIPEIIEQAYLSALGHHI
jgi:3-(3-hydroxy-phenyl)propionate hydroxylase